MLSYAAVARSSSSDDDRMIAEFGYILAYINKCSAVAKMGDCLAILDMGQKLEAVPLWGGVRWVPI